MRLVWSIAIIFACLAISSSPVSAGTPIVVSHQGYLLDGSDQPVTGSRDLTFKIYEVPSGGAPLWTETIPSVSIQKGLFSVSLGNITPIDPNVLTGGGSTPTQRYLEVTVGGVALLPRQRLGCAPYAALASRLDGDISTAPGQVTVSHSDATGASSATLAATTGGASSVIGGDLDGDGKLDVYTSTEATSTRSELKGHFQTGDIPTQSQFSTLIDSKVANSSLGIAYTGQWTSSSSTMCSEDSTVREVSFTGPPGPLGTPALMKAKEKANRTKCSNNLRCTAGNGASSESDISCDSTGARMLMSGATSLSGSSGSLAVDIFADSTSHEMSVLDPSGYGMKVKEKGNRTKCSSNLRVTTPSSTTGRDDDCDGISARTVWSSSSSVSNSVTIEASTDVAVNPIEHSSGAHLTPGGVWTNASDVNLKENFRPVDGEALLQKIERLPISEWNYKAESDDVTHIGPTAQDFRKVFGVGENDKSISTIDPSGIALAAIKQLSKENEELKARVEALTKMVEELAKKK